MKFVVLIFTLLLVVGCASKPQIIEKPRYIEIPVLRFCAADIPSEPSYETSALEKTDDLPTVADAYMIEAEQRKIYIARLKSILTGCVSPKIAAML